MARGAATLEGGMGGSVGDDAASRFATAPDGLRLHYRDLAPAAAAGLPLVCLPGLTRTVSDFDALAEAVAAGTADEAPRRVVVVEYRGRGASDVDPDPSHYNVGVESADVAAVLDAAGIAEAVMLGTSRGGLITLILAAVRPELIRGAILNDIGPVLEPAGLERIRSYVGRMPTLRSWEDAVAAVKRSTGADFTALSAADWRAFAALTFEERDGGFSLRYDPALTASLKDLDPASVPPLWDRFPALFHAPLLVIRGGNSDLLSPETAAEMVRRHPDAALVTVAGQGHAPLLRDAPTIAAVARFARRCDETPRRAPSPGAEDADPRP